MRRLRLLLALEEAQETRFFLFLTAFAFVIGVIYWFVSYEVAGTVLLLGFSLATGVIALHLAINPASARVRERVRRRRGARAVGGPPDQAAPGQDALGGGAGDVDRPFLDESGRLPAPTLAPLAVGLGVSLAATAPIFGPAPLVVGALPFAWGTWTWLRAARSEFAAVEAASRGLARTAGAMGEHEAGSVRGAPAREARAARRAGQAPD